MLLNRGGMVKDLPGITRSYLLIIIESGPGSAKFGSFCLVQVLLLHPIQCARSLISVIGLNPLNLAVVALYGRYHLTR